MCTIGSNVAARLEHDVAYKFQCFVCASSALNNVEICRSIGESIFLPWNVALVDTVLSLCYTEADMKIKLKLNFWVKPCWPLADTTLVKYSSCKSFIRNIKKTISHCSESVSRHLSETPKFLYLPSLFHLASLCTLCGVRLIKQDV